MGKPSILKSEIKKIRELRETGHSLNEIKKVVNRGYGTIFRYVKDVPIPLKYKKILEVKRGGSKSKSLKDWSDSRAKASEIISSFNFKEKMIVLSCLYWGEGNKTELNIINSDPTLIKVVLQCLKELGIKKDELKFGLRLFEDIDKNTAVNFWSKFLKIPKKSIKFFEIKNGKRTGRLKYGMCRLRVKSGGKYFKLIMSMIDLIRSGI